MSSLSRIFLLAASIGVMILGTANAEENVVATIQGMKKLDGAAVEPSAYDGKVLLLVNVASRCGFTKQYKELQQLHEKYGPQGLAIIGVPCNQFGSQEPGTPEEIQEFCSTKYGVSFDLLSKVDVNGDSACELYKTLTAVEVEPAGDGPIKWNFEKFIVGKDGQVVARFSSRTKPDDKDVVETIEREIAKGA